MKEIRIVEEESQKNQRRHELPSRKSLLRNFIYLPQVIQQDNLKTNLSHLLKPFIVGDELAREVEAMTQVINIHCDES